MFDMLERSLIKTNIWKRQMVDYKGNNLSPRFKVFHGKQEEKLGRKEREGDKTAGRREGGKREIGIGYFLIWLER